MKTMKGPGIVLAQFVGPDAPFNSLPSIAKWAQENGFVGVQILDLHGLQGNGIVALAFFPQ